MNTILKDQDQGKANASGWYQTICKLVAALECGYDRLEELQEERDGLEPEQIASWDAENGAELRELTDAATIEGDLQTDADAVRECIQEGPLSVEVRSGWASCKEEFEAEEFCILLSTGGPALRIRGDLDNGTPTRAWLEYQDWGTPWTQYFDADQSTLLTYCQQFYFGE